MEREQHLQTGLPPVRADVPETTTPFSAPLPTGEPMNGQRGVKPFLVHRQAFARLIVALLPLILAACTTGGGGGAGY
jgi:hypothetical protein